MSSAQGLKNIQRVCIKCKPGFKNPKALSIEVMPSDILQVYPGWAGHPDGFLQVNPGWAGHPEGFLQVNTLLLYIPLLALTDGQNYGKRNKYTRYAWAGGTFFPLP